MADLYKYIYKHIALSVFNLGMSSVCKNCYTQISWSGAGATVGAVRGL